MWFNCAPIHSVNLCAYVCNPGSILGVFFSYFPPVLEPKYYNELTALNLATTSVSAYQTKDDMAVDEEHSSCPSSLILTELSLSPLLKTYFCSILLFVFIPELLVLRHWAGLRMSCNLSSTNSCIKLTDGRHLAEHPSLFMGSLTCPRSHG